MSITTLAQAKLHLRVDHSDEDTLIQIYLDGCEKAVSMYLNRTLYASSAGSDLDGLVMNDAVKSAVLLQVGNLYANREASVQPMRSAIVELPFGVKWLLDPFRINMGM
jgi:Phage gp6-like head-tail connector protein